MAKEDENFVIYEYLDYRFYIKAKEEFSTGIFIWHVSDNFISPLRISSLLKNIKSN